MVMGKHRFSYDQVVRRKRDLQMAIFFIFIIFILIIAVLILNIHLKGLTTNEEAENISHHNQPEVKIKIIHKTDFEIPRTIYAIETSNKTYLNYRQACSLESAAKSNPDMNIVLLMATTDSKTFEHRVTRKLLEKFNNIEIEVFNVDEEFRGTKMESWYKSEERNESKYKVEHLSQALRYLIIYKRGGIYMDLDTFILKSLDQLGDFMCTGSAYGTESSLFGFLNPLHPILNLTIERFEESYDPISYNGVGPPYFVNMALIHCLNQEIDSEDFRHYIPFVSSSNNTCGLEVVQLKERTIDSQLAFVPDEDAIKSLMTDMSIVFHMTNHLTSGIPVRKTDEIAYVKLMKEYCPEIFSLISDSEVF